MCIQDSHRFTVGVRNFVTHTIMHGIQVVSCSGATIWPHR